MPPVVSFQHKDTSLIERPEESDNKQATPYFEKDFLPENVYYNFHTLIDSFTAPLEGVLVREHRGSIKNSRKPT